MGSKLGFVEYFKVQQKPTNNKPSKYQLNLHRKCQGISQFTKERRPGKIFSCEQKDFPQVCDLKHDATHTAYFSNLSHRQYIPGNLNNKSKD